MTGLCSSRGVPHKNWLIVGCYDLGEPVLLCEWCGVQHVRYVHVMGHKNYKNIEVGCVCAETISLAYKGQGKIAEEKLKKEAKEKTRLATRADPREMFDQIKTIASVKEYKDFIRACGWKLSEFKKEEYRIYNERIIARVTT